MAETNPPIFVALFAGGGGLTLGFERAGFRCVGLVEKDAAAAATLRRYYGTRVDASLLALGTDEGDIRRVDFDRWAARLSELGHAPIDVIVGGPPCQAFSRVGRGKLKHLRTDGFLGDQRNSLWRDFFRAVQALRPRSFVIENVPGMLHHGGANVAEAICEAASQIGYRVKCGVLNAAAFGVPQTRERLFVIGVDEKLDTDPELPSGTCDVELTRGHFGAHEHQPGLFKNAAVFSGALLPKSPDRDAVSSRDALADLPAFRDHLEPGYRAHVPCADRPYRASVPSDYAMLMRKWPGLPESTAVSDHVCKATPRDYQTFARMEPGDRYPDALEIAKQRYAKERARWQRRGGRRPKKKDFVPPYRADNFPEKWRKLVRSSPSWTVTAHLAKDTYSHIHYDSKQARMITVREAARLQSFPDAYQFSGNIGDKFRQIGNAVPPLMACGVASALKDILEKALPTVSTIACKQLVAAKRIQSA